MSKKNFSSKTNNTEVHGSFSTNLMNNFHSAGTEDDQLKKKQRISPELLKCDLNTYEDHENNIGFKLLHKWGFQPGKGLGKQLQGINAPVKVCLRKGRKGFGYDNDSEVPSTINKKNSHQNETLLLKKVKTNEADTPSNLFDTTEEIRKCVKLSPKVIKPTLNRNILRCKVIDMTKPQPIVFDSYHAIGKCQVSVENSCLNNESISSQEFQDTFKLSNSKSDQNAIQNDIKINDVRKEAFSVVTGKQIPLLIPSKTENMNEELCSTTQYDLIIKVNDLLNSGYDLTSREIINLFESLYKNSEGYNDIFWSVWVPQIKNVVQSWDCKQPEELLGILELWLPLIPSWILNNLLEMIILPKLTTEVEKWSPTTDTIPINLWLHPWLPLINSQMNTLIYPIIRSKLKIALDAWHPSDHTAILILEPWSKIFKKQDMNTFLTQNILPKLKLALSSLTINPAKQNLEQWYWVHDWKNIIPPPLMAEFFDKYFFPKWFQVLSFWLNNSLNSIPNYGIVVDWCTGWRKMFNKKLLAEPVIKGNFDKAFQIIDNSILISQGLIPDSKQPGSSNISSRSQVKLENIANEATTALSQSFKDIVQKKCENRNILFMPLLNRYYNSKQIFKVGSDKVYIDCGTLFIRHSETSWLPIELDSLLHKAKNC